MAGFKRQVGFDEAPAEGGIALGLLADQQASVFCQCQRCGHAAAVEAKQLMRQLGPDMAVAEVGTRMRCSGCGAKDVATQASTVALTRSGGHAIGYHSAIA